MAYEQAINSPDSNEPLLVRNEYDDRRNEVILLDDDQAVDQNPVNDGDQNEHSESDSDSVIYLEGPRSSSPCPSLNSISTMTVTDQDKMSLSNYSLDSVDSDVEIIYERYNTPAMPFRAIQHVPVVQLSDDEVEIIEEIPPQNYEH